MYSPLRPTYQYVFVDPGESLKTRPLSQNSGTPSSSSGRSYSDILPFLELRESSKPLPQVGVFGRTWVGPCALRTDIKLGDIVNQIKRKE